MMIGIQKLTALAAIVSLAASASLMAAGGQNSYGNPNGHPYENTFETPYANPDGGRMMIFCAEDEKLVVTPVDTGAVEVTCVPADD